MMNETLKKRLDSDILDYKAAAESFKKGELTPADYKAVSGGFGTYPQRILNTL